MSEQTSDRRPGRSWYFFLDDMVVFAKDVLRYTAGMDQPAFESDGLVFDATLRKLERRMHRHLNPPPARPLKRLQRRPKRRCSEYSNRVVWERRLVGAAPRPRRVL